MIQKSLFILLVVVLVFLGSILFTVNYLKIRMDNFEKKHIEKFTDPPVAPVASTTTTGPTSPDAIKKVVIEEINKIYDIDVESIRNLGMISKSLLTGKNYHNHNNTVEPGTLIIPANVIIEGSLTIEGTSEAGNLKISSGDKGMSIKNNDGDGASIILNKDKNITFHTPKVDIQGELLVTGETILANQIQFKEIITVDSENAEIRHAEIRHRKSTSFNLHFSELNVITLQGDSVNIKDQEKDTICQFKKSSIIFKNTLSLEAGIRDNKVGEQVIVMFDDDLTILSPYLTTKPEWEGKKTIRATANSSSSYDKTRALLYVHEDSGNINTFTEGNSAKFQLRKLAEGNTTVPWDGKDPIPYTDV